MNRLDKETAEAVSKAVQAIALSALAKPYIVDQCMIMITQDNIGPEVKGKCIELISAAVTRATSDEAQAAEISDQKLKSLRKQALQ